MPWVVTRVQRFSDKVPNCPDCKGSLTVKHAIADVYHCTCGCLFEATWQGPTKAIKGRIEDVHYVEVPIRKYFRKDRKKREEE